MAYTAIVLCVILISNVIIAQPVQQTDNKDADQPPVVVAKSKFVYQAVGSTVLFFYEFRVLLKCIFF